VSPAERRQIAISKLIEAIAYRDEDGVRVWLRRLVWLAPRCRPLVIVCAADGAGTAPHDSNGGSSKTVLATERDIRAALERHADLVPSELRARLQIRPLTHETMWGVGLRCPNRLPRTQTPFPSIFEGVCRGGCSPRSRGWTSRHPLRRRPQPPACAGACRKTKTPACGPAGA
jgi:hypothetical protein